MKVLECFPEKSLSSMHFASTGGNGTLLIHLTALEYCERSQPGVCCLRLNLPEKGKVLGSHV